MLFLLALVTVFIIVGVAQNGIGITRDCKKGLDLGFSVILAPFTLLPKCCY
jgi:hypothetical protein